MVKARAGPLSVISGEGVRPQGSTPRVCRLRERATALGKIASRTIGRLAEELFGFRDVNKALVLVLRAGFQGTHRRIVAEQRRILKRGDDEDGKQYNNANHVARGRDLLFRCARIFAPNRIGAGHGFPPRRPTGRDAAAARTAGRSKTIRLIEEHPSGLFQSNHHTGLDSSRSSSGTSIKHVRGPTATPGSRTRTTFPSRPFLPAVARDSNICQHPGTAFPDTGPLGASQPTMRRSRRFALILRGAILASAYCTSAVASQDYVFYHDNVMGTSLELSVRAGSALAARRAEERVLAEIDRLAAIFSGYDMTSEFSRWQAAPRNPCKVSRELYDVLYGSERWDTLSGGAFDPRVEVLSRLWERCSRLGRLPTQEESAAAQALMKTAAWRTDAIAHTADARVGLPDQSRRHRQGIHRREGLRCRDGNTRQAGRPALERRRRFTRARLGRQDHRDRGPLGRFRVVGTVQLYRSQGPVGRHERQVQARISD